VVEDGVDAARGETADRGGEVVGVGVVVDRFGTEGAQGVVVADRGGADDADAGMAGELHQGGADAAAGPVDHDGRAGADPGLAVEQLPGGDAVDHDGLHLGRVEPLSWVGRGSGLGACLARRRRRRWLAPAPGPGRPWRSPWPPSFEVEVVDVEGQDLVGPSGGLVEHPPQGLLP